VQQHRGRAEGAGEHLTDVPEGGAVALSIFLARILAKRVEREGLLPVRGLQLQVRATVRHFKPGVEVVVGHREEGS
jgi:hypothetical protein